MVEKVFDSIGRKKVYNLFKKGKTLAQLCEDYIVFSKDKEFETTYLKYVEENLQKRKSNTGITGDLVEWIITGHRKSSSKNPDLEDLWMDIKCLPLRDKNGSYFPTEKLSITSLSWNNIEEKDFYSSNLSSKSKFFMVYFDDSKFYEGSKKISQINHLEREFIGIEIINLEELFPIMEQDYEYYRTLVKEGRGSEIGSEQWCRAKNQILHVKQAGNGAKSSREYVTKTGVKYTGFPRKWNIGQGVIVEYFLHDLNP